MSCVFFFQAEDGIRDDLVTGVQTCALPISHGLKDVTVQDVFEAVGQHQAGNMSDAELEVLEREIGRASCRERV